MRAPSRISDDQHHLFGRLRSYPKCLVVRFPPRTEWRPPCFGTSALYNCQSVNCFCRQECEGKISPWVPSS